MNRAYRKSILTLATLAVTGCGSVGRQAPDAVLPRVEPTLVPPIPTTAPAPTVQDATPEADAARIAKQAEQHAKAIEALLAARSQQDVQERGVRVVEPERAPQNPLPKPTQTSNVAPTPAQKPVVEPGDDTHANASIAITPAEPRSEPKTESRQIPTPPAPEVAPTSGESLEQQLARRAREYPRDLASQLDYQLALFIKDQQVPRAADIAGLTTEDREVLTAALDGLSNFRNLVRGDSNLLMNRKIRPLVDMSERLRGRADLNLPTAAFCTEVRGFGVYTPMESQRFPAGAAQQAIIYTEVENFSSQLNAKNQWETRLKQEIVLYTESGLPVWNQKTNVTDVCRNRRRDFYTIVKITIPANLTLGRYVLKVSVIDDQASRVAETSLPLAIVAK